MKVCCLSDLHGHLPELSLMRDLNFDLLLIGGDIVPTYAHNELKAAFWLDKTFRAWLEKLDKPTIGVSGNHDFIFQRRKDLIPKDLPWIYLEDSGTVFQGLNVWGSPWQLPFYDWAFNAPESKLQQYWNMIPDNTDILLLHGPPYGYGDFSPYGHEHTGSPSLTRRILDIQPKLVCAGHIHSQYGKYMIGEGIFVNASYVDEKYQPSNIPIVVDL